MIARFTPVAAYLSAHANPVENEPEELLTDTPVLFDKEHW
jgi:hypothetical protein